MKFFLSFVILTSVLSADTCYKLGLGNAALTPEKLCAPNTTVTAGIKCDSPASQLPTQSSIKCDLPTTKPTPAPIVAKCTPLPVECPKPTTPVIPTGGKCDPTPPKTPSTPSAPEPASYALLGAGLVTAGVARRLRKKTQA